MNQEVVLILMQVLALILAFSVHECAHAWTAWRLGDPTARMLGRVTLNPLKHLDPFGSVLMPLVALVYHWPLLGWAKPTPVTPRNFKNYRRDDILVTLAGPTSNLVLATFALILLLIIKHVVAGGAVAVFTAMALAMHMPGVSTENLPALFPFALLLYYIILINLLLFVFNLVPFPPLDGSRILRHFLPYSALQVYDRMGVFALWIFMFLAGGFIFRVFLYPLQSTFDNILAALLDLAFPYHLELNVMTEQTSSTSRPRVLSGMRPTGKLHLGNYMGALYNWVKLQHQYECYFFIADYHALTTDYASTGNFKINIREVALDFLAAGLDPALCAIFVQSQVPAHFELNALLAMITPLSLLERVPTYKDQQEQLKEKDLATYGFLGYPLLQSADILIYQASYVPVGQDQAAHVELTREVARRFNQFFPGEFFISPDAAPWELGAIHEKARKLASDKNKTVFTPHELYEAALQTKKLSGFGRLEVLPEPQVLLTPSPKLPGTDGRKMSKSYGNTILLSDPEPEIRAKLRTMVTDPARVRRDDVGNPDVCPVFDLHRVFSSEQTQLDVRQGCTTAGIGCIECKGWLADALVAELAPIRERRTYYQDHPRELDSILDDGNARANARANITMREVRATVGLE